MIRRLTILLMTVLVSVPWSEDHATAVEPIQVELNVHSQRADSRKPLRLLPADPDLKEGNASVVLLRMIWEQRGYMQTVVPQFGRLAELPYNDPQIAKIIAFDGFNHQLHRAAYMRTAEWQYPLHDELLGMILLPDVQGLRNFAGRGLSLWIGTKIASGDLDAAQEGVLTQLACARHMARTPLVINNLVAYAVADRALQRLELLMSQTDAPNFYWALGRLPDSLGDTIATLQWEAEMLPRSLPSLKKDMAMDDPNWRKVANEFVDFVALNVTEHALSEEEVAALQARLLIAARTYLQDKQELTAKQINGLSKEAVVMRWVLSLNRELHSQIESAYTLPAPLALKRLGAIESAIEEITESTKSPVSPFPQQSSNIYLAVHRFDRRVKILQTVEAIRDFAAQNSGALPKSLDELRLPAPNDPMTQKPFEYELTGDRATLKWAKIDGVDEERQMLRTYSISILEIER